MRAPCNVGKGLVDGDAFDGRREIAQDSDGGVAEPLVFGEMSADKNKVGTELPRASSGHAAPNAERPRLVRGRENDTAADGNGPAAQARVKQLFDGRVKGVEVRVENGGCGIAHHTDQIARRSANAARNASRQPTTFAFYSLGSTSGGCSGCGGRRWLGRRWSSRPPADRRRRRRTLRGPGRGLRRRRGN